MGKKSVCLSIFTIILVLIGIMAFSSQPALAKTKILRLVVPSPAGDWPLTFMCDELAKRFNARAEGQYKIQVYPGGALVGVIEYFDAARTGAIEIACAPWAVYGGADSRLNIVEAPFLFASDEAAIAAAKPLLALHDEVLMEKFNQKAIGLFTTGCMDIISKKKQIKVLEDWKGELVAAFSPPAAILFQGLGASPVTIMWPEMFQALQKGVVDVAGQTSHGMVVSRLTDVCKYFTHFQGLSGWNGFSINLDVYNDMPENIKKVLHEETDTAVDFMHNADRQLLTDDIKEFKKRGVEVYILPKSEYDRWTEHMEPVKIEFMKQAPEFSKKVQAIADEANKNHPYVEIKID